jgi:hypothetical protein
MKKKIFHVLFAVVMGVSFSLMAAPAIASSLTFAINESPSPVFFTLIPDQAYVIKDNVNYKLYYAGSDFASINLAQSPDGITWTPYSGNPIISDGQYHADVKYYNTGFPGANSGTNPSSITMYYRMWYAGLNQNSISGWRYAESPDGINWYNHISVAQFGTPVYSAATGVTYGIADVIYTPGATNTGTDWTFRIYANVQWEIGIYGGKELVVMAFSSDGYNWTGYDPTSVGYATPVFAGTLDPSRFDCDHIGWFKVIKNSSTDWEAFYSGGKDTTYKALNGIGYATSTDGINWTRSQTLFTTLDGVAWRSQSVWMPSVVKTGDNYQIWFLGSDNPDLDGSDWIQWKLGMANLTVASTIKHCDWVEYGNNPVFGQWIGGDKAYYPKVIYDFNQFSGHGDTYYYKMWFGSSSGIGYAYSNDGINWTAGANPVTGPVGGAGHPLVEYDSNGFGQSVYYKMWYWTGNMTYSINDLWYAESTDGINWTNDQPLTQDSTLPLVTSNPGPDWNAGSYGPCDTIYNPGGSSSLDDHNIWNNKYVMYYMGTTGGNEFIGLAYSANGTFWKRYGNDPILSPCTLADDPNECWDYYSVGYCSVIKDLSGSWQMWYGGGPGTNLGIGYATSPDGINWTKDPDNPIFHVSDGISWSDNRTYTPWVLYDAASFSGHGDAYPYKMWFSGKNTINGTYSIGYAYISHILANAGTDQTITAGGSAVIGGSPTASGGIPPYTYSWTPTTGLNDPAIANPTASPARTTTYIVKVTDNKGCTDSDNMTVSIRQLPPAGGGGGIAPAIVACPVSLTADIQGAITIANMSGEGVLCNTCIASDAAGKYTLEMDKGTQLLLAGNTVPRLLEFRELSAPPPTPENTILVGPAYEISAYPASYATVPSPVTISPPAMLTLTYDPKELPENATEVFIADYDKTKGWQALAPVPGVVAELGKAQGLASHFSPVAVLARVAEPKPAAFNVSDLTIIPGRAQLNQEITIGLKVTNTGQQSGDYKVQVRVDGLAISNKQVTVAGGASQTVNITTAGYAVGKHQVEIAGLNSEFEVIGASPSTDNHWWFFSSIAALMLVAIGLVIALRK